MKKRIKSILGRIAFYSSAYKLFFRKRAVIVLFHRVDDRLSGDPISCTTREFHDYCEFFRRYFEVISLSELLDRLATGLDISRSLVITFDDGYKDNLQAAAAELQQMRLPACFFVATNFIESQHVPWWDDQLPFRPEWMSWNDVRELQKRGFEIGSHTMNHVDLGKVVGAEAETEIRGSRQRIASELGSSAELFSYPYGRIDQLTEENREAVARAGYRCCISAYGGAVDAQTDPFRVKRTPISPWYESPYHFGFEALFLKP